MEPLERINNTNKYRMSPSNLFINLLLSFLFLSLSLYYIYGDYKESYLWKPYKATIINYEVKESKDLCYVINIITCVTNYAGLFKDSIFEYNYTSNGIIYTNKIVKRHTSVHAVSLINNLKIDPNIEIRVDPNDVSKSTIKRYEILLFYILFIEDKIFYLLLVGFGFLGNIIFYKKRKLYFEKRRQLNKQYIEKYVADIRERGIKISEKTEGELNESLNDMPHHKNITLLDVMSGIFKIKNSLENDIGKDGIKRMVKTENEIENKRINEFYKNSKSYRFLFIIGILFIFSSMFFINIPSKKEFLIPLSFGIIMLTMGIFAYKRSKKI